MSGIIVALIGGYFTYVYNVRSSQQEAQTREHQARLQELQTVVQLMPYLTGQDENAKRYAITAIQTLGSTKIATELAKLNPSKGVEDGLAAIAANAGSTADRRLAESALNQIRCGVEGWNLKTLTDPESPQVDLRPQAATVDQLRSIERPSGAGGLQAPSPGRTRLDVEKRTYLVRARLTAVKLESSSDYDLILADPKNLDHTLTARIPAPECAKQSAFRQHFLEAREAVSRFLGAAPGAAFKQTGADVEVQGVGYFTFLHGQRGIAPNGFELHPVLSVKFLAEPKADATQ